MSLGLFMLLLPAFAFGLAMLGAAGGGPEPDVAWVDDDPEV